PPQRVGWIVRWHHDTIVFVYHQPVGRASAIGDPCPRTCPGDRLKCRNKPACRNDQFHLVSLQVVNVRFAVGHDDHLGVRQFLRQDSAYGGGRPLHQRCAGGVPVLLEFAQKPALRLGRRELLHHTTTVAPHRGEHCRNRKDETRHNQGPQG